jgi:hypothetical protein
MPDVPEIGRPRSARSSRSSAQRCAPSFRAISSRSTSPRVRSWRRASCSRRSIPAPIASRLRRPRPIWRATKRRSISRASICSVIRPCCRRIRSRASRSIPRPRRSSRMRARSPPIAPPSARPAQRAIYVDHRAGFGPHRPAPGGYRQLRHARRHGRHRRDHADQPDRRELRGAAGQSARHPRAARVPKARCPSGDRSGRPDHAWPRAPS